MNQRDQGLIGRQLSLPEPPCSPDYAHLPLRARARKVFLHMSDKVFPDAKAALDGLLHDNMTIAAGGFGLCGIPEKLISALHDSGVKSPTLLREKTGGGGFGIGGPFTPRAGEK